MTDGDLVVVNCGSPREKFWGVLLGLTAAGVSLRCVPVESFEDYLRQFAGSGPALLGAVTIFLPAHRIERVELDETAGAAEGLGERFRRVAGRDPREALLGQDRSAPSREM
jgi:hypothetical protein